MEVGTEWSFTTTNKTTAKVPHTSNLMLTTTAFYWTEILERSLRGFSTALTEEDAIHLFGNFLHISRFDSMEQQTHKLRLIYNSSETPNAVTLKVNASSDKSSIPKAMHFGPCLAQLLQRVWEADNKEGPVWLSRWDISDAFH